MITNLHIKNIGIIDEIEFNLNNGVNVLTGETGAGKSLIIDSLNVISGGRFSKEMIRKGKDYSLVEVCIYDPQNEISEDGNIIVTRQIFSNGKNICKVNGRYVTVNELKDFMKDIIDIHEQNDNQSIMDVDNHIKYLDSFIGKEIEEPKKEYYVYFNEYKILKKELIDNYGNDKERERTLDLLKYELNEIESANLQITEEEKLEKQKNVYLNSQRISESLEKSDDLMKNSVICGIEEVIKNLSRISDYSNDYNDNLCATQDVYYSLQDIMHNISDLKYNIEYDEKSLKDVEDRLDLIYSLKRKYGNNITEILKYKEEICTKINKIENLDNYINDLKNKIKVLKSKMTDVALKMNGIREEYIEKLEKSINNSLDDLEMPNAKFYIENTIPEKIKFNENGISNIEFKISTNVGQDYKPLVKIASGGEVSRIMIAIKSVLSEYDTNKIMVLDEIDSGISGKAARAVGEKIKKISKKLQVICVTHLPVVAAVADYNYYISKDVIGDVTKTEIKLLDEKEVISEIARISNGEVTETALQNAYELRKCLCIA